MLVLDVSGSMAAKDAQPSRLGAARAAALRFVDKLPKGYRMALVTFSDHAAVVVPATHDLTAMRAAIAREVRPAGNGARGGGHARSRRRPLGEGADAEPAAAAGDRRPLLGRWTDRGARDAGPGGGEGEEVGHPGLDRGGRDAGRRVVLQPLKGGFTERIQVPAQPAVLQSIARGSAGRFYASIATVDVKAIYRDLGSRVGRQNKTVEVTAAAAGGGLVLMLAGAVLSGLWFRRFP